MSSLSNFIAAANNVIADYQKTRFMTKALPETPNCGAMEDAFFQALESGQSEDGLRTLAKALCGAGERGVALGAKIDGHLREVAKGRSGKTTGA